MNLSSHFLSGWAPVGRQLRRIVDLGNARVPCVSAWQRLRVRLAVVSVGAMLLSSCLVAEAPLFNSPELSSIPGVSGRWQAAGGKEADFLYIRENADGTYAAAATPGKFDMEWGGGFRVAGDFYVVQMKLASMRAVYIAFVQVFPKHLISYTFTDAQLRAAARQARFPLKDGNSGPYLAAETDRAKSREFFSLLAKASAPGRGSIYLRAGGFTEDSGDSNTLEAIARARKSGDLARATQIAQYLARRGDREAQAQLAEIYSRQQNTRAQAIRSAQDAFAQGDQSMAPLLALLYHSAISPSLDNVVPRKDIDYQAALYWLAHGMYDPELRAAAAASMKKWSREACTLNAVPEDRYLNCVNGQIMLAQQMAVATHEGIDLTVKLMNTRMEIEKLTARVAGARRRDKELEAEQQFYRSRLALLLGILSN